MRRRPMVAVRLVLFALVSVTVVLANSTYSAGQNSTSILNATSINGTDFSSSTTDDYSTTASVHPSTVRSSTAHSSSAATTVASTSPHSTETTQANDSTVSPSASSTVIDDVTSAVVSSTRAVTTIYVSSGTTAETITSNVSPVSTDVASVTNTALIAVLAVVIPVLVLIIIAGVLFYYRKRLRNSCEVNRDRESISEDSLALPQYTSLVVNADEFLDYINDLQRECDFKYAEQFESLQLVGREQTTDQALLKCNVEKNRYINIHPYDITRVKLLPVESEDGSDYINSSWIPGYYSKREYIAAQGPLPATEDDMWRMVWEYKCKGIIMLTKCMEGGRKKCDQYWPEDMEPVVYGDIQVVLVSETSEGSKWTIKKLELSVGQQKRTIKLLHFIEWPDNGVPESPEVLLEFMQVAKKELETMKAGPLVIHCSAGVGRTGTYIAIETLLLQLENEKQVDVFGIIYRLRLNRVFMVQTEIQYKFIHETIGHVIRKQNEKEQLSEDAQLLNHNEQQQPTTDPEDVQVTEIEANTHQAPDVKGMDNPGFELPSQT